MGTNRWKGDAPAVAQVITLTVGSSTAAQTFITTINGKSITYTAGGAETTTTIATAIQALLQASTIAEFKEVAWTTATSVVTGTAATAGVPFVVSKSGTGTYTLATTVASSGPNDASTLANWSTGALPANTDDLLIDGGSDILYGLNALSAPVALNTLRIKASFTGNIGLPYFNAAGYVEYRTRFFPVATTVPVTIGEGAGTGPTRVYLATGLVLSLTVLATGTRQSSGVTVVNAYGFTSGTANIVAGDVGFATDDDTLTGTLTTLTCNTGSTVTVGTSVTVTTANNAGAKILAYGTITTLNNTLGPVSLYVAPTTITADGGRVYGYFTGTVATATFRGQGNRQTDPVLDFSNDPRPRTVANHSFTGGSSLLDPDKTITFSNAGAWDAASQALSNFGARFNLLRS